MQKKLYIMNTIEKRKLSHPIPKVHLLLYDAEAWAPVLTKGAQANDRHTVTLTVSKADRMRHYLQVDPAANSDVEIDVIFGDIPSGSTGMLNIPML